MDVRKSESAEEAEAKGSVPLKMKMMDSDEARLTRHTLQSCLCEHQRTFHEIKFPRFPERTRHTNTSQLSLSSEPHSGHCDVA